MQIGDFFEITGCSESANNQLYQVLNISGYNIEVYETVTPMVGDQNILFEQKSRSNIIGGVLVESEFCDVIKLNLVSTIAQTQTSASATETGA